MLHCRRKSKKHGRQEGVCSLGDIRKTLTGVMSSLVKWSHDKFGAVSKELEKNRERMEELSVLNRPESDTELMAFRRRMDKLLYREVMMWLQHSRVAWLKEGDRNTEFFHQKTAGRAKKNKVKFLKKADGQITKDKTKIEAMTTSFFRDLYTADPAVKPEEILGLFEPLISDEINNRLRNFWMRR
jgi:hypothetical protein